MSLQFSSRASEPMTKTAAVWVKTLYP